MASWRPDQPSRELNPHLHCNGLATTRVANSSKTSSRANLSDQQPSASRPPSRASSTKSSTLQESIATRDEIQLEDDMTLPLKIKASTNIRRTGQPNKHEPYTSNGAHMGISASNLDRQIADFFYETPGLSSEMERLPFQSFKSSANSLETRETPAAYRSIHGHEREDRTSLDRHDDGVQSLKMAGSRPPSPATSGRVRTKAGSLASSHGRGTDQPQSPGYLFIHELPPLPPLQTKKPKLTSLIKRNSSRPDDCRPFHTAEEKGKGRSRSTTVAGRDELVHHSNTLNNEQRSRPVSDRLPHNPSDEQRIDISSIIKSPQHAWYFLRRLVGLELRWEAARAWRLTTLDYSNDLLGNQKVDDDSQIEEGSDSDDESSYSASTLSTESSTSAANLPMLRYLLRHFFLTLPIIRDTVVSAPNHPHAPHYNSSEPMYWTAGVLPVLRRLHQSNLSATIDLGSPGFLSIFFGSYVARMLERFIATSIEFSHQEDRSAFDPEHTYRMPRRRIGGPQFRQESKDSNVVPPESTFFRQSSGRLATDPSKPRITEDQVLFSMAGCSPKATFSHHQGFDVGPEMSPDNPRGFNQLPAVGLSHSYAKPAEQANETFMRGFEKEPHWYSGVSLEPSQRASIGVFTPSNSNCMVSPSSHLETTEPERPVNDRKKKGHNNMSTDVSEIRGSLLSSTTYSSDAASPLHTSAVPSPTADLFTWIPNVFDNIEAPPMDLSRTVGFSHGGNSDAQDSHSPRSLASRGFKCKPEIMAKDDAPSVRKKIQELKLAGGYQSEVADAQEKRARTSRLLQEFSFKNLAVSKTPSIMRSDDGHHAYDRGSLASQKLGSTVLKRTMSLDLVPNNPSCAIEKLDAPTRAENNSKAVQNKVTVEGYDVVETEAVDMQQKNGPLLNLLFPSGRQFTTTSHDALQVAYHPLRDIQTKGLSTESLGHYQKRTNKLNAYQAGRQSPVNLHHKVELLEKSNAQSPTEFGEESKPRRRFTLRSLARWRQSGKSEASHMTNSAGQSHNEKSDYVFSSDSPNAVSSTWSRSSSAEGTNQVFSQPRSSFYAEMTVPESLIRGLSQPYKPIQQPASIPIQLTLSQIPKDSVSWPWGDPVPFWKGTPVHKVSWGGFEADIVGIRQGLTGNRYLIRVRRPSRLDEYVVRKESQFKKYLSALSRDFPNAHIRMIPNHETSFEDEIICPDFYLNEPDQLVWGDLGTSSRSDIDSTHILESRFNQAFNSIQHNQAHDIGISIDKSGRQMKFQEPSTSRTAHFPDRPTNYPQQQIAPDRSLNITDGDSKPGMPKRRNTLASLFGAGNMKSKFSFDTRSDLDKDFKKGNPRRDENHGLVNAGQKIVGDSEEVLYSGSSRHSAIHSMKASPDAFRRALRGWLRDTLSIRTVGHHRETAAFLLLGSIVPGEEDLLDIRKREMIDEERKKKRVRVAQGAAERAKAIHEWWSQVKEEFIDGQGIENLSIALRQCATVEELPNRFQKALEWMRMNVAEALHELLVIGNQSDVLFGKLLGFNAAFPWFLIKNILKIRKPDLMCKTLVEVLLSKKLLVGKTKRNVIQRLVEIAINETDGDSGEAERRIQSCRARIQSLTMCEKIIKFVHASREIKNLFRCYAESENLELVVTIVRSAEEPRLDEYDLERIVRASQVYKSQLKKHRNRITSSMTGDINVRLILDLKLYLRLIAQERDSKQIREMFSDQKMAEALEVIIFPFTQFLKRTYTLADASQAVDSAQKFVEQLITIVNALRSRIQDPQKSVRVLSRLLAKHQNRLYGWLHSIHLQESIIEEFLQWLRTAMRFLKQGLLEPISISQIISPGDAENLENELDELVEWEERKRKLQYEQLCRRYSADVDGDDPVIVEGDGFGRSKVEPLTEARPSPPHFDHITNCLTSFRMAISRVLSQNHLNL